MRQGCFTPILKELRERARMARRLRELAEEIEAGKRQQCRYCWQEALHLLGTEECLDPEGH